MPGVRALLVDLYGTVLVSAAGEPGAGSGPAAARHLRHALDEAAIRCPQPDAAGELLRRFELALARAHRQARGRGRAWPEVDLLRVWRHALLEAGIPLPAPPAIARLAAAFEARVNPCAVMPGARAALSELRGCGLVLGVVSNAQFFTPTLVDLLLGLRHGRPIFDPACCVWSWRAREAKPSPALLRAALRALRRAFGIRPGETAVIGNDVRNDLLPARQCGCRAILFAGDRRSLRLRRDDPSCRGLHPDAVVTRWTQVAEILRG